MKSQGYSNGSSVGTGNFCTKFSNTGTILREIAHVRKRYDNPGESTIWRAPASRAVYAVMVAEVGWYLVLWHTLT